MEQLRFITTEYTYADFSTSVSPALERAMEEGVSESTAVLNIFREGSFTVGVFEDPEKSLDLEYCRRQGITVRRRVNPGGSIWGPEGSAMLVLYVHTRLSWVPLKTIKAGFEITLSRLAEVIHGMFGLEARYRPLNDVEVGGRKLVATSARLEKDIMTMRLLINVKPTNPEIMQKAIKTPPEKMQDKKIKDVAARFTCLENEIGKKIPFSDLEKLAKKTIKGVFGDDIDLVRGELSAAEKEYAEEYKKRFTSDDWYYENSERMRFRDLPDGAVTVEGRHKAPAGLIRVTLLVHDNAMHNIIITGDFHPSPYGVLKDMENELMGKPCDEEIVRHALTRIFSKPGVEIAGTEVSDFVSAFLRAFEAARR